MRRRPGPRRTERLVPALAAAGADVIELGVPFSDPLADGPTIQAAAERALRSGTTLRRHPGDLVARLRSDGCEVPLVLMGYMNPIVRMGVESFVARSAEVGVDGFIVPDLPLEEADPLGDAAAARGLSLVLLAAPTTPPERLRRIGQRTRGFLYFVSITGVTGARAALPADLPARLDAVRAASAAPVAVGFGISDSRAGPRAGRARRRGGGGERAGRGDRPLRRAGRRPGGAGARARRGGARGPDASAQDLADRGARSGPPRPGRVSRKSEGSTSSSSISSKRPFRTTPSTRA